MPLEIESKFYVNNLPGVEARLKALGAVCLVSRQLETNLRFDDGQHRLQTEHKVLRLRRYDDARLTFKSGKASGNGVATREEIEVIVSDFEQTRALLEGLGFRVFFVYEKYRALYRLGGSLITLDELPFGSFVEVEAESAEQVYRQAEALGLNPAAASAESYQGLFAAACRHLNPPPQALTFQAFAGALLSPADLGMRPADEG